MRYWPLATSYPRAMSSLGTTFPKVGCRSDRRPAVLSIRGHGNTAFTTRPQIRGGRAHARDTYHTHSAAQQASRDASSSPHGPPRRNREFKSKCIRRVTTCSTLSGGSVLTKDLGAKGMASDMRLLHSQKRAAELASTIFGGPLLYPIFGRSLGCRPGASAFRKPVLCRYQFSLACRPMRQISGPAERLRGASV